MAHGKLAPGSIRMQWWREMIHSLFKSPSQSLPYDSVLLEELAKTIRKGQLTRLWFDRILDARVRKPSQYVYGSVPYRVYIRKEILKLQSTKLLKN